MVVGNNGNGVGWGVWEDGVRREGWGSGVGGWRNWVDVEWVESG